MKNDSITALQCQLLSLFLVVLSVTEVNIVVAIPPDPTSNATGAKLEINKLNPVRIPSVEMREMSRAISYS